MKYYTQEDYLTNQRKQLNKAIDLLASNESVESISASLVFLCNYIQYHEENSSRPKLEANRIKAELDAFEARLWGNK